MTFNEFVQTGCKSGLDWAKTIALCSKVRRPQIELWIIRFNHMFKTN